MFTDNTVDTFEKGIYPLVIKCFLENEVFLRICTINDILM